MKTRSTSFNIGKTQGDLYRCYTLGPPTRKKRSKIPPNHTWLVVSDPLKHIGQLGWLFPIYEKKIKVMFQTTNQIWSSQYYPLLSTIKHYHKPLMAIIILSETRLPLTALSNSTNTIGGWARAPNSVPCRHVSCSRAWTCPNKWIGKSKSYPPVMSK